TKLAKKYGIATPYTSYLVVPDAPMPVAGLHRNGDMGRGLGAGGGFALGGRGGTGGPAPAGLAPENGNAPAKKVADFAKENQKREGELAEKRNKFEDDQFAKLPRGGAQPGDRPQDGVGKALSEAKDQKAAYDQAREALRQRNVYFLHTDKLGVDLSCQMASLKSQSRLQQSALRSVGGRNC